MMLDRFGRSGRVSAFILGGVLTLGVGGGVLAQDATQTPTTVVTRPAHIHVGDCTNLDPNPLFPLNDVGPRLNDDDEMPSGDDIKGSLTAAPVEISETEVEVKWDDLFATAHAINIHESAQNIQNYVACGDIGGPVLDDKLFIGLTSLNDSGYAGIAMLEKDGDDKVKVTIYLGRNLSGVPAAPGTPTPTS